MDLEKIIRMPGNSDLERLHMGLQLPKYDGPIVLTSNRSGMMQEMLVWYGRVIRNFPRAFGKEVDGS